MFETVSAFPKKAYREQVGGEQDGSPRHPCGSGYARHSSKL